MPVVILLLRRLILILAGPAIESLLLATLVALLRIIVAGVALYLCYLALDFLNYSLGWSLAIASDASIVRYESWSILQGNWPWRDLVSINLPFTHLLHIFGIYTLGADDLGFRRFDYLWVVTTALLFALYLHRVRRLDPLAALLFVAIFLTLPIEATPLGALQRETLLLPFLLGQLWLFARIERADAALDRSTLLCYAAIGALSAAALLVKPTTALLPLGLWGLDQYRKRSIKYAASSAAGATSGAALVGAAIALWLASNSMLIEMIHGWSRQTAIYVSLFPGRSIGAVALELFTLDPRHLWIALNTPIDGAVDTGHLSLFWLLLLAAWLWKRPDAKIAIFLVAMFGHYILQQRGFQYHLYPLWFGMLIVAADLTSHLLSQLRTAAVRRTTLRTLALALTTLFIALSYLTIANKALAVYSGTGLYERPGKRGPSSPRAIPELHTVTRTGELAATLRRHPPYSEGATIHYYPMESSSFAIGAAIPHRLEYATPYLVDYILWLESAERPAARHRFLTAMQQNRPEIFLFATGFQGEESGEAEQSARRLAGFVELRELLDAEYDLVGVEREVNGEFYRFYIRSDLSDYFRDSSPESDATPPQRS